MAETMTLIAGRSSKQGVSLNVSKLEGEYVEVTTTLEMNVADMARLGLQEGDQVRLRSRTGETVLRCKGRKAEDLPEGILFMAYGPSSSQLMGGDTAGTGMPLSKNLEVEVERVA
ncbi:MAG: tRNA CCA-pyrophosphorylase [Chloroflexota bacterium]|nr:MAG: tRNA CCA-pyrophosphorylase [Chloroflexota bacterium]